VLQLDTSSVLKAPALPHRQHAGSGARGQRRDEAAV